MTKQIQVTFPADLSLSDLTAIHNDLADKPVKKFKNKTTAEERALDAVIAFVSEDIDNENVQDVVQEKTGQEILVEVSEAKKRGRRTKLLSATLHLTGAQNPARANTVRHATFALVQEGDTVQEFYDRVRESDVNDRATAKTIKLMVEAGFVTVTE